MEGSVSNVQFSERRRGFDPDEVANYLAQIDDKIASLRAMASDAIDRAEQAEERVRHLEHTAADEARRLDEAPSRAAGILDMAQRTADATVSEARAEADSLLARAREDADRHRLSAEAEAQQVVATARREMEQSRAEHLEALRAEIDGLVATRDAVASDIAALEEHLASERDRVRATAAQLTALVDNPSGLAPVEAPEVAEVESFGAVEVESSGPSPAGDGGAGQEFVTAADFAESTHGPGDWPYGVPQDDPVVEASGPEEGGYVSPEPLWGQDADRSDDGEATAAVSHLFDEGPDTGVTPVVGGPGGFGDSGDVGAVGPMAAADESAPGFAGTYDDEDDEAMRAFFEGEPEEDKGSRWGRRRR